MQLPALQFQNPIQGGSGMKPLVLITDFVDAVRRALTGRPLKNVVN